MWKGAEEELTNDIFFRLLPETLQEQIRTGQCHQMNQSWGWLCRKAPKRTRALRESPVP